jgi:PleD family two-component response regulator
MPTLPQDLEVLVADGQTADVTRMRQVLREMGLTRTQAIHDGLATLVALKREHVDLLLIAADLPRMDGLEVLTYLHKIPRFLFPRTILIADQAGRNTIERATQLGVTQFFVKPFEDRILRDRVRKALAPRS